MDASTYYVDSPRTPNVVTSVDIHDRSTVPGGPLSFLPLPAGRARSDVGPGRAQSRQAGQRDRRPVGARPTAPLYVLGAPLSFTADRVLIPDPGRSAACLEQSLGELAAAIGRPPGNRLSEHQEG
ncbi:MAG: hypothetical protein JWO98_1069 [Frankiales bacterium]|nr:hypothetical protein [Frankiales bacterium]